MSEADKYDIVPIPPNTDKIEEILVIMEHFFDGEPISTMLGVKRSSATDDFFKDMVRQGTGVMALERETGRVVGVRLGYVINNTYWEKFKDRAFMKMLEWGLWFTNRNLYRGFVTVIPAINAAVDYDTRAYFGKLKCNRMLADTFVCVSPTARGARLGERLVVASEQRAMEMGATHAIVVATGFYSQRIFKKLPYTLVKEVRYDEMRLKNGDPLPNLDKVPSVHTHCITFTREL
eukprot:sb/3469310/